MTDPLLEMLAERDMQQRTTAHADPTIQRALTIANQPLSPVKTLPFDEIIRIYEQVGSPMSMQQKQTKREGLGGFRVSTDPRLLINEDSRSFRNAAKNPDNAAYQAILASILLHEQVHDTERGSAGEFPAHRLQEDFLRSQIDKMPKPSQRSALLKYMEETADLARMYQPKRSK